MMTFQAFLTMIPVACAIIVFVWNMKRTFHNASSKQNFIEEAKKDGRTAKAELVDTWITSGSSSSDGGSALSRKKRTRCICTVWTAKSISKGCTTL